MAIPVPEAIGPTEELSAAPLMELTGSFWAFKTLAAAVELGLFSRLAGGRAVTVGELAGDLSWDERPVDMLLAGCASLGLLEKEGEGYRNSALSEAFLVEGRPGYFGGWVRYADRREYPSWHRLLDALAENRPVTWDPETQDSLFSAEDTQMLELFWDGMDSISSSTARTLGRHYDFGKHRRLLDVGGGGGTYPIELCRMFPGLRATVFDLPHVCRIAEGKAAEAGLNLRVGTVAGDFLNDEALPDGYDVLLLSMILHDWDEETGRALLGKCRKALVPGGTIIISEQMLNPERTGPRGAALMGVNMIVETTGGRNYSETEYLTWLGEAGFTGARVLRFESAGANGVVMARNQRL
ncbi:methyltransferase [Sciscionella sediminilitoris]|uniref:methyltransferase n=1 Tax=Sciscionella sediminilitoris TaxID=1445613 RepID=UPI000A855893|nr:methyltransferase [Sciscionella sp. SE31]